MIIYPASPINHLFPLLPCLARPHGGQRSHESEGHGDYRNPNHRRHELEEKVDEFQDHFSSYGAQASEEEWYDDEEKDYYEKFRRQENVRCGEAEEAAASENALVSLVQKNDLPKRGDSQKKVSEPPSGSPQYGEKFVEEPAGDPRNGECRSSVFWREDGEQTTVDHPLHFRYAVVNLSLGRRHAAPGAVYDGLDFPEHLSTPSLLYSKGLSDLFLGIRHTFLFLERDGQQYLTHSENSKIFIFVSGLSREPALFEKFPGDAEVLAGEPGDS